MIRRASAVVLATLLVLVATVSFAAWLSTGSGLGSASATSVAQAAQPSVSLVSGQVTITWAANSAPVDRYDVYRHVGASSELVTSCTGVTGTTCTDTTPDPGTATYGVVARYKANWRGPESPLSASFTYDSTAPSTSISRTPSGTDSTWHKTDVDVTLTATDAASGVKEIHYTVDGGTEVVVSGATTTFTVSREDSNNLGFWSVDNAGNIEAPQNTAYVKIDKTAPVTTATVTSGGLGGNGWYTSDVNVSLVAGDTSPVFGAASGVVGTPKYQVTTSSAPPTAESWSTAASGTSATVSGDGNKYLWAQATDLAGNVESQATGFLVKIDTTDPVVVAPTVFSGTPGTSPWYVGATAPVVKFSASDATSGIASLQYQIGATLPGSWLTYNATNGISVPESSTTTGTVVNVRALDNAGLANGSSITVKYDGTAPSPPTVTVNPSSPDGSNSWYVTTPKVTGSGSTDSLSGVDRYEYRLGAGTFTTVPAGGYAVPDGGAQVVTLRTIDGAGNISATTASSSLKIDTTDPVVVAPTVFSGTPGTSPWYVGATAPVVKFSASDATSGIASLQYQIGATLPGSWLTYNATNGISVPESSTTTGTVVNVRALDNAGLANGSSITVKYDGTAPSPPTVTVNPSSPDGSNSWYVTTPKVTGSGSTDSLSGVDRYEYRLGAGTFTTVPAGGYAVPDGGAQVVTLRTIDGAGNISATTASPSLKVDTFAPTLTPNPPNNAPPGMTGSAWKGSTQCERVSSGNGSAKLCVSSPADTSGLDSSATAPTYTFKRLAGSRDGEACWANVSGVWGWTTGSCTPVENDMSWRTDHWASSTIATSLIEPSTAGTNNFAWVVSGVRDRAGNLTPPQTFAFSYTK